MQLKCDACHGNYFKYLSQKKLYQLKLSTEQEVANLICIKALKRAEILFSLLQ